MTSSSSLQISIASEHLQWFPELQLGWYPVPRVGHPYDAAYWEKYRAMDATPVGEALTKMRLELLQTYCSAAQLVVDVGIGGGAFCSKSGAFGYDINPDAINWLNASDIYLDPYEEEVDCACFWDSLEHIHDPSPLLANVRKFALISCPIFEGPEHVLKSKHYRKDEHCWYFTAKGLEGFMAGFGFRLREINFMEQRYREDIGSFVFERAEV